MAYDVASGTRTPDAVPAGGLDNLQAASATGGFVLTPVEHDPFAQGGGSEGAGTQAIGPPMDLEPALGHGTLTQSDKTAMAPYAQGMFDTHVSQPANVDLSGSKGEDASKIKTTPEIMPASEWGDFVSNLQNGNVPFDDLPDKYKDALKGKRDDYELARMGITQPLASLTKSLFNPSAGSEGKEGGRVGEDPDAGPSNDPAFGSLAAGQLQTYKQGDTLAGGKPAKATPSGAPSGGKFPEAQAMYAQLVSGLPDGQGGWIVPPLPPALAAAKVGSSMGESYTYLDPLARGDPIKTKKGTVYTAHGLDQWHSDRWNAAQDWIKANGGDPNSREWQAWYGSYEMQQNHGLMAAAAGLKDPTQMVPLIVHMHEGADPRTAHIPDRQGFASAVFSGNTIFDTDNPDAPPIPVAGFDPKTGLRTQGPQTLTIQSLLSGLGYYHNKLDGDFGPATRAAVKLFQSQNMDVNGQPLKPDGLVGVGPTGKTMNALLQAYANKYGMTDKIQHLLPVSQDRDPNAIYSPGFAAGGPGSTGVLTPSVLRDLKSGVSRGAGGGPAPPVLRGDTTNKSLKSNAMLEQLRGWTGDQISSGLTPPSPDKNALFGAPTLPQGAEAAFGATSPVPGFPATTPPPTPASVSMPRPGPMEPGLGMPPMTEPGVTDPTAVIDQGITTALGAVTNLPAIRAALASAGILDPQGISDVPPGRKGWPGAGEQDVPPGLVNEEFPARPEYKGGSEFQTWYKHIQDSQPNTVGLIQRAAKSQGKSEESVARDIYKKVKDLEENQKAKDLSGEQRSSLDSKTQLALAEQKYYTGDPRGPLKPGWHSLDEIEQDFNSRSGGSDFDRDKFLEMYNSGKFYEMPVYNGGEPGPGGTWTPEQNDWDKDKIPQAKKKERSRGAGVIV